MRMWQKKETNQDSRSLMINLILAMTEDYTIGNDNSLPWKIKEEMQYFVQITTGNAVLMGRKTFESIGKPLSSRLNIILTRDQKWTKKTKLKYPQLEITNDLDKVIQKFINKPEKLFIIGGKEVFYQTYPYADQLYISVIKERHQGNVKLDFFQKMIKDFLLTEKKEFPQFVAKTYYKNQENNAES